VGSNLSIDGSGVLSSSDNVYNLPKASASVLGGVKQGNNITIDADGVLSATFNGSYNSLINKPNFNTNHFDVNTDIITANNTVDIKLIPISNGGTGAISAEQARTNLGLTQVASSGSYNDLTDTPTLSTVATSGSYTDLTYKPNIPVLVNSDWNATTGDAEILNKPFTSIDTNTLAVNSGVLSVTGGSQWTTTGNDIYYNSGNVGINVLVPTYKLEVSGDFRSTYITTDKIGLGTDVNHLNTLLDVRGDVSIGDGTSSSQTISLRNLNGLWHLEANNSGISNANRLVISTQATTTIEHLTIQNNNGYVGIGKDASYKLDIDGDVNIKSGSKYKINGNDLSYSDLDGSPPTSSQWTTTGSDNIYYNSTGRVGIGKVPSDNTIAKLDVNGFGNFIGKVAIQNDGFFQSPAVELITFETNGDIKNYARNYITPYNNNNWMFDINASMGYEFQTNSNPVLYISSAGNVSIGDTTTEPDHKLVIDGDIKAKNIIKVEAQTSGSGPSLILNRLDISGDITKQGLNYISVATNNNYCLDVTDSNSLMGIEMRTNTTTRQYIAPNGNIRIGDALNVPSYKLEVDGTLNVKGDIYKNGVLFEGGGGGNYKDLIVNDETRTITSTTSTTIQEPTYDASSYITQTTIDDEYKYIKFDYFANTFDFREDESPYSWQEAYDEAIANGKRMATKTEFRNYLSGLGYTLQTGDPKPPLYSGDTWCFCTGDDGISYDAIQIGEHGSQYVGSSLADILSQTDAFWTGTYTDSFPKIYLEVSCKYYINFPQNTTCDILVIGGGGGGGYDRAGGAGAGACIVYKGYIMNGTYDIKTGNGGGGQSSTTQIDGYHAGKNGFDSEITSGTTTLFRAKGGGGGAQHINSGRNGGCGGGAGSQSSTHIGGVATANIILGNNVSGAPSGNSGTNYVAYGSSGGSTFVNYTGSFDNLDGSGGGGIGENGQDKTSALGNNGGKGGDGRYNFTVNAISNTFNQHFGITGHLVNGNHYIGGGGGGGDMRGGVAGIGGGGGGGTGGESNSVGNNASAYGAGGGGGGGDARAGGNGYDGVVVIRYKYATISTTTTTETYTPTGNLIYCRTSTNDYEWKFSSDAIFNELSYQYKLYDMMYDLNKIFVNYEYSVNNTNYYPMFAYDVINENDNIYKINVGNSTAKIRIGKTSLHYIEKMRPLVGVSYNGVKIQLNYFNSGGTYLSQSEVNYTGSILDTIDIDSSIISTNMGQYGTINDVIIIELKLLNTTNSLIEYDSQFFLLTNAGTIA
jgi:hypothetical protein